MLKTIQITTTLVFSWLSLPSLWAATPPSQPLLSPLQTTPQAELDLRHNQGVQHQAHGYSDLHLSLKAPAFKGTFSVSQAVRKLYIVDRGEPELQLLDSQIAFATPLPWWSPQSQARLSWTLPLSITSRQLGHISTFTAKLLQEYQAHKTVFGTAISFDYYLNQYRSSPASSDATRAPTPLNHMLAKLTAYAKHPLTAKFSLHGAVYSGVLKKEDLDYGSTPQQYRYPYGVLAKLSLQPQSTVSYYLRYSYEDQSDGQQGWGRYIYVFDEEVSLVSIGVTTQLTW